jgi:hypothetical protein
MPSKKCFSGIISTSLFAVLTLSSAAFSETILNNENGAAVMNAAPPAATQFTLNDFIIVNTVRTYHWNNGKALPAE